MLAPVERRLGRRNRPVRRLAKQGLGPSAVNIPAPAALVHGVLTAEHDYAALYRVVGPALWHAIYAYAGGLREIADDAVAEAFARAIQYDRAIRRPPSWLYRTAFRIAAAELRRRSSLTKMGDPPVGSGSSMSRSRRLVGSDPSAFTIISASP